MPNRDLNNMRQSYETTYLLEEDCDSNPFIQFDKWFQEALKINAIEPNAMQLATVGANGQPSIRTVLLKSFDKNGFIFYTNYTSKKGKQLEENNKVALLFWLREQERQVIIEGSVSKIPYEENSIYFHSRPRDSQLAAKVSNQSSSIKDRATLEELFETQKALFENKEIPLKESWGGYLVVPTLFEFWQGRANRLHDRIQYKVEDNNWKLERLMP